MINLNELLKQAYPNSTHGGKGISASLLKSMGDVRFSRPMEDRHSLDDYMIDMLDEKGNPIVEKEKDTFLLGKSIEELLVGGDRTWAMQPAYKKKFNKIKRKTNEEDYIDDRAGMLGSGNGQGTENLRHSQCRRPCACA